MRTNRSIFAALALLALMPGAAQAGFGRGEHFPRREGVPIWARPRGGACGTTLADVIREIRGRYPGQLLDASGGGESDFRVIWLTNSGRKLVIFADGCTGAIKGIEG